MPRLKTETFGSGDQSWLGSSHGICNARTETIDISAFTAATHYPDGYIPSGTPIAIIATDMQLVWSETRLAVPYDVSVDVTTKAGILAGFILTDQPVVGEGDFAVPILDHGRVNTWKVPYASFTKPLAEKNETTIVFAERGDQKWRF